MKVYGFLYSIFNLYKKYLLYSLADAEGNMFLENIQDLSGKN